MKMSKVQTISVIAFLAYSIIIGSLVFSRGFLLNRQIITDKAGPCLDFSYRHHFYHENENKEDDPSVRKVQEGRELLTNLSEAASWCNQYPVFKKAILILVDALRYDFVGRMQFLSSIVQQQNKDNEDALSRSQSRRGEKKETTETSNASSCMFRFIADPPTTTMQRLKALMTGTMPTFIDASANFNSYEVEEDSLIYQLQNSGKRLAFLGDDTWLSLFPPSYFKSPIVEAHPSFNAWDLDTVDRAVNHSLRHKVFTNSEWDVLVTHILGVDHCGHRYGPSHPEMQRKLNEADEVIEFVKNSMSEDTLLVVFGDHGMTHTGDHGGDSKDEMDSAVIFISKNRRIGGGMTTTTPNVFHCPSFNPAISQIDLVPTLATLLGVPIPYSSLGQIIPNFLTNKRELYADAVSANAAQVERYSRQIGIGGGDNELQEDFDRLQQAFHSFHLSRTNHTARAKVNALAHRYLTKMKLLALSTWTQFNVPMIYTGVIISSLAVLCLSVYLVNVPTLLLVRTQYSVLSWLWPSLPLWSVLWSFVKMDSTSSSNLLAIIICTFAGLVMFILTTGLKLLQNIGVPRKAKRPFNEGSWWDYGALIMYIGTCFAMFSNSFVISEGFMVGSILTLVVFLHFVFSSTSDTAPKVPISTPGSDSVKEELAVLHGILIGKRGKCSFVCLVILGVLVRICSIFFRCREELQECTEEYLLHKQLASLPDEWLVHKYVRYSIALVSLAIFVVAFRLWMLYQKCLFSKTPAAIIAKFVPTLLVVMLGVFWALQGLPFISTSATKLRPILNYFPWVFQATTFISLVLVWFSPMFFQGSMPSFGGQSLILPAYIQACSDCALTAKKMRIKLSTNPPLHQSLPEERYKKTRTTALSKSMSNGISTPPKANGLNKFPMNGAAKVIPRETTHQQQAENKTIFLEMEQHHQYHFEDISTSPKRTDDFSSSILLFATLIIVLMTQITSVGMAPAVSIIIPYIIVCLVGIFRNQGLDSWCSVVAWTLASQFLFYGTGHQPIFSAIPWDSAFLSVTDGQMFTESAGSWITWLRPAFAVLGNLYVSQIVFSLTLPLLSYWTHHSSILCQHQQRRLQNCHSRRKKAYVLSGKYILLHGLKLLCCMMCAGWHRRHLMVWKIFAPKFIFEAISFIVTTFTVIFSLVFITRIDYLYHRNRHKWNTSPSSN